MNLPQLSRADLLFLQSPFICKVFEVRLPSPKHFCSFFIAVKKLKKYTSFFGAFLPLNTKKMGSEAADRPLRSPILHFLLAFAPKCK